MAIQAEVFCSVELPPGVDLLIDTGAGERHYSVSGVNPSSGVAHLAVVIHGGGPGALWAAHATVGREVWFMVSRPQAIALDASATWHVFFGDETSVSSTLALLATTEGRGEACFEVIEQSDCWPDVGDVQAKWLFRGVARPGKSTGLLAELSERIVPEGTTVYVTGETWLCAVVSSHFRRALGFPAERIRMAPYWKLRPPLSTSPRRDD